MRKVEGQKLQLWNFMKEKYRVIQQVNQLATIQNYPSYLRNIIYYIFTLLFNYLTVFSSLATTKLPIVERQAYIFPASIEYMRETITEKGITSKHIIGTSLFIVYYYYNL